MSVYSPTYSKTSDTQTIKNCSYILIDSKFRNITTYNNPSTFLINSEQTNNWVENYTNEHSKVKLNEIIIHYDTVIYEPFVKISFYNLEYNDRTIINSLDDNNVKFVAFMNRDLGNGWIRYKSPTKQNMRFFKRGSFSFTIWDKDNNVLNVGTNGRIISLFKVKKVNK
uniref:Uncharacterized protein n=1 Tax=viral metagenome TaxID=1070528 RepID=A0A6C0JSB0_9ZZZZ